MSKHICPCGTETKNNYLCNDCIEDSLPAYMVDKNGKIMSIEELMENSTIEE